MRNIFLVLKLGILESERVKDLNFTCHMRLTVCE